MATTKFCLIAALVSLLARVTVDAADRQGAGRRLASAQGSANGHAGGFQSACGTSEQVAKRIGQCLVPTFDIIEGRTPNPKGDQELVDNCERFASTERCVRSTAKDCLSGLPKTATNTIPAAIKRFRNVGCKSPENRAKYRESIKCAIKKAQGIQALYRNHTAITQNIRDLPNVTPEEKIIKLCCLLNSMDREIERQFETECPKEVPVVISLVHAITDDARNTLCLNPKCQNALNKVIPARLKQQQNFIEPISQIIFMLNTDA